MLNRRWEFAARDLAVRAPGPNIPALGKGCGGLVWTWSAPETPGFAAPNVLKATPIILSMKGAKRKEGRKEGRKPRSKASDGRGRGGS